MNKASTNGAKHVRCAVYTRVSTAEQAELEYSSIDAQGEACAAYVASQQHAGWSCLPGRYDDPGFTGADTNRPAFRRLMADIESGRVDCVVCYKLDRLTRSIIDFAKTLEVFEKRGVTLVAVTQAFDTSTATGRLMMHILMSFAEFERQLISERTRDKIASARRKGKWSGGMPILGYTVVETKLVIDNDEAQRVRQKFGMYVEHQSLLAVVKELNSRGWRTKRWTTRKGKARGGRQFDKNSLYQLLTNVAYIGKVKYKDEVHEGEHEAIINADTFAKVQTLLQRNGRSGGRAVRNKHGALLRGLLRCAACDCAMSHSFAVKRNKRYRYYTCTQAQQRGWDTCPSPSVPAGEIERFVVDQIKCIGRDPALVAATLAEVRRQSEEAIQRLTGEKNALGRQLRADEAELHRIVSSGGSDLARLAEVQERIGAASRRMTEIEDELLHLAASHISDAEVTAALAEFDSVWEALAPREQARVLELIIEKINYDGQHGNVSITFHPNGIQSLAGELVETVEAA